MRDDYPSSKVANAFPLRGGRSRWRLESASGKGASVAACWLALVVGVAAAPPGVSAPSEGGASQIADEVGPLLSGKCLSCHAPEPKKGGLDLSRLASALAGGEEGAAIVPGRPDESLLLERIAAGEMPRKNPLKSEQVAAVRRWIEAGAPYPVEPLRPGRAGPDWWSLRPIVRPRLPRSDDPWVCTPIDAFVLAKLTEHGLSPSPEADRAPLIRRASFDLTGLPPSPEEVAAFIDDAAPDAYERLIDRLLASPHYGERWGRHWLDVVRFGESHGYESNRLRPNAWPYRDYVIRAFNRDTPLDRFALEQLAGDTLAGAGVRRGFSFSATDEFGYRAVENVVDVHDFHATVLHLLGLDHEKLTYYQNGTQRRLTDVHGRVIREILA